MTLPATPANEKKPEAAPNAILLSIRALANQGRLADSLALCTRTIAVSNLDPELHYLHATILQELNREEEAIASLRRALYLDPNLVPAYFALGSLAMRRGDVRTGRRNCENALALLATRREGDVLPEAEGLTTGRFREMIQATIKEADAEVEAKVKAKEESMTSPSSLPGRYGWRER